jgi:hypothetical protein
LKEEEEEEEKEEVPTTLDGFYKKLLKVKIHNEISDFSLINY